MADSLDQAKEFLNLWREIHTPYVPTLEEVSKQMRINADCIMKEITEHADREIERINKEKFNHD